MSNDLGMDRSGNGNNFTVNNITYADQVVDSPTNNFATLNPLNEDTEALAEGNLQIKSRVGGSGNGFAKSTMAFSSGKWYAEYLWVSGGNGGMPGISPTTASMSDGTGKYYAGASGKKYSISGTSYTDDGSYGSGWSVGDIIGVAMDADANTLTFYKNNSSMGTAYSSLTDEYYFSNATLGGAENIGVWNFGQDSSFAGNKTAQGNQDGNDIGDFYYTPPTGFLALCTSNLPDVAVTPSEHFNTVAYTGDGNSTHAITGVNFQPDLVWFKRRNEAASHVWIDAVRGSSKRISSDQTDAESTSSTYLTAFNTDGFTTGNNAHTNENNDTYVAWNWKANGSGSSNTDGSITSTVSANVDAGFSIVTYTGTGTNGSTIGHGLSKAPDIVIVKRRNTSGGWYANVKNISSQSAGADMVGVLNSNIALDGYNVGQWYFGSTAPNASTFTVQGVASVGANNDTHVAYCFHSVDGYSKVGSYTGNGNADGTFVYTGFKPMMIIYKRSSASEDWYIRDTARDPTNPGGNALSPNSSGSTSNNCGSSGNTCIDYLSNGFKLRGTDTQSNDNGSTYIYIAFAETPFKYSNAR